MSISASEKSLKHDFKDITKDQNETSDDDIDRGEYSSGRRSVALGIVLHQTLNWHAL